MRLQYLLKLLQKFISNLPEKEKCRLDGNIPKLKKIAFDLIRLVNATGNATKSNIAFKRLYRLYVESGMGGYNNYIALPYNFTITWGSEVNNAKALRCSIENGTLTTLNCSSVNRWNQISGLWESFGLSGTNFTLIPGECYRVVMKPGIEKYWTCPVKEIN